MFNKLLGRETDPPPPSKETPEQMAARKQKKLKEEAAKRPFKPSPGSANEKDSGEAGAQNADEGPSSPDASPPRG